jgi:maltooligosyltrehalose trehalohydrolase
MGARDDVSAHTTPHTVPGAYVEPNGTTFVVWSTVAREVAVRLFDREGPCRTEPLEAAEGGYFARHLPGVGAGALYKLVLDGHEVPDPYARFLPCGVHGPARVVSRMKTEALPEASPLEGWVIYELHVGTFSPEGTYRSAIAKLDHIVDLGATAIELLPIAAFPGERGWGYDGVALYAPHAPYGEPDDLRAFVRAAHQRGLAVILDVVYNHFGPSGNYLWTYAPEYFAREIETPWGPAPDFAHAPMRRLVLDNVRYWLEELGFDGLRLDATHQIRDGSQEHILREITNLAHAMTPPRRVFFEDERNDPTLIRDLHADGVWADDVHHQLHVLMTGERDGYYGAYEPTVQALATAIRQGWTYIGEPFPPWKGAPRGKAPRELGVSPERLLYSLQNHDQIGNRALGTRLTELVSAEAYRSAVILLLFLPATPLLFMGQEWAASSPFLFFSDHESALGEAVRQGRREEFKSFAAFADAETRAAIPDPQARETFERSKLRWGERSNEPHASALAVHKAMLRLRREDPVLRVPCPWCDLDAKATGDVLQVTRRHGERARSVIVNFGRTEHALGDHGGLVLCASSACDGVTLAPGAAIVLARP